MLESGAIETGAGSPRRFPESWTDPASRALELDRDVAPGARQMRTTGFRAPESEQRLVLLLYDPPMVRRLVGFTLLLLLVAPSTAYAYLDPGSSSLLFQAAAAALFTLLFVLKTSWNRIRGLFRSGRKATPAPRETSDPAPGPGEGR